MDERIIIVLKAAAIEHVIDDDFTLECVFCHSDDFVADSKQSDSINHHPECATLLARGILRSLGSPMGEYYVTGEQRRESRNSWRPLKEFVQGCTEEEVRSHYPYEKRQYPQFQFRNVKIEKVRDL